MAAATNWDADEIPDQAGRVVIVTGSTSGLGEETARVLAAKNAKVVMAVRNTAKGEEVAAKIRTGIPNATIVVSELDLSSLESTKKFAAAFLGDHDRLDLLINNAGVMFPPYTRTKDDWELTMATNHLCPFALTLLLLPLLRSTPSSRVVTVSSAAHTSGKIDMDDINWTTRPYKSMQAYSDSKIANLHFTVELARRIAEGGGEGPMAVAAHPGWTRTDLQRHNWFVRFLNNVFSQGVDMGALPTLRAAIDPEAKPGNYFGPQPNWYGAEFTGYPVLVKSNERSKDVEIAKQLWDKSEALTGVKYSA
mmetsp:Transcript_26894/g.65380  ORF Transcript_26894/g.65380 Transcript_26894/m.65380 type:complete len:307 (+) Transcript_26894:81-1001(+)